MSQHGTFDFAERAKQKADSRLKDMEDIRSGVVNSEQINRRNGFFSGLDFSGFSIAIPEINRTIPLKV